MTHLLQILLERNQIKVDGQELQFQLQSHPSYPSLHSLTGVLTHFGVENLPITVPSTQEVFDQLPETFLGQVQGRGPSALVIVSKKGDQVDLTHENKSSERISTEAFLEQFTGVVLAVEPATGAVEGKGKSQRAKWALLAITLASLTGFLLYSGLAPVTGLFLLTIILGGFISGVILQQEQGVQTLVGNAFCSGATSKRSCDAVLGSKGAVLAGDYKLSDLSLSYFAGLMLASLLLWVQNLAMTPIYMIALLAIPVTIYSIYYQYVKVKKWCTLCMAIVGVVWTQAAIGLTQGIDFSVLNEGVLFSVFLGFALSFTLWLFLAPAVRSIQKLDETRIEYLKFKKNFELFQTLHAKSEPVDIAIPDAEEMVFGNPNAALNITIISSPLCMYCVEVHEQIEQILDKYPDAARIQLRFYSQTEALDDPGLRVCVKAWELYDQKGAKACLEGLHAIYSDQRADKWLEVWGDAADSAPYVATLKKQEEWCNETKITFTPEILVNGRSFPSEYNRSDLIYFIQDLQEWSEEQMQQDQTNQLEPTY